MNTDKLLNLILSLAIVLIVATNLVSSKSESTTESAVVEHEHTEGGRNYARRNSRHGETDAGEVVYNNIMTRSSVRDYTDEPIADELLERIVKAGMAAPTAMNKQPWKFVIVNDKALMKKLSQQRMLSTGAAAIVVCGDMSKTMNGISKEYWIQDTSAASENILLSAHGFGLGAVWTGVYPSAEKVKVVQTALNLPQNLVPLCVIVLGHPALEPKVKDKWVPENLIWNRFDK